MQALIPPDFPAMKKKETQYSGPRSLTGLLVLRYDTSVKYLCQIRLPLQVAEISWIRRFLFLMQYRSCLLATIVLSLKKTCNLRLARAAWSIREPFILSI